MTLAGGVGEEVEGDGDGGPGEAESDGSDRSRLHGVWWTATVRKKAGCRMPLELFERLLMLSGDDEFVVIRFAACFGAEIKLGVEDPSIELYALAMSASVLLDSAAAYLLMPSDV